MADMLVYGTLGTSEYSLINLVRNYPVLYNPQDPCHHDRARIDATWAEIGRQLNKEKEWCFSKWANLLDDYKKRKAIYDSMGTSVTMMSWLQYDALSFLDLYQNNPQQQRDNTSSINQNPAVHAGPPEPCYSNGITIHQPQQQAHHPPPQQHQQLIVQGIDGMGGQQGNDTYLQFRTVFKCPTCLKSFSSDDKVREHIRTKQCFKSAPNNPTGGNVQVNNSPTTTIEHNNPSSKKKKLDPQQQMEKYADENMRMLPSQASSTTTTNSSDLEQADNSNSGSGGTRKGGKNSTRVTCTGCGRSFQGKNSKYALKKHYQSHYHDGPSSWGFTCSTCGKKCQFQFKLDEHMRTHSKEQPFECDQCGRKFSIKFNLKRHIKLIHKIETPYLKSQNMKNA